MFKHGKSSNSITEWILKDTYNSYYKSLHSGLHGLHFSSSVLVFQMTVKTTSKKPHDEGTVVVVK